MGNFQGVHRPCKDLLAMAKQYDLDDMAITRVADILGRHTPEKKADYLAELDKHLEVASRPSATVMLMLKKISDGKPLGAPTQPAGKGAGGRDKDHGRRRSRSRSRDQARDRDRDRDRDRGR